MNDCNGNFAGAEGSDAVRITRSRDHPITRSPLRILYVAYPLLTVSEESAGGAEQMLLTLEREMAGRGAITTVAASAGSRVSGELFATGLPCTELDDFERRNCEHQDRIVEFIRRRAREDQPFDLIHDKSGSFWARAAEFDAPVLATLHLPRHFYAPALFENVPANVSFNCVSEAQARSFRDLEMMLGSVPNGIALERFESNPGPRKGLLWLGRICEEKAPHLALEIAKRASRPITIAGQVYPFSYHQRYFEHEVAPRLNAISEATFIPTPSAIVKRSLLATAEALLITSVVDETSSLVAMEAAASETPVVAFRRGALPEIVAENITGLLVDDVKSAVSVLSRLPEIAPLKCARFAREHYSSAVMAEQYSSIYANISRKSSAALSA